MKKDTYKSMDLRDGGLKAINKQTRTRDKKHSNVYMAMKKIEDGDLSALKDKEWLQHIFLGESHQLNLERITSIEAALHDFSLEECLKILGLTMYFHPHTKYLNISFEKLMQSMYYDYKGKKSLNIYKKRIVEQTLDSISFDDLSGHPSALFADHPHMYFQEIKTEGKVPMLFPDLVFSKGAKALVDFCVEAEDSESIYEKAILLLYDYFDLRRDAFDRFHDEENYLNNYLLLYMA